MYLAHAFQRDLEKEFVVVQWDRRAAGKWYREDVSSTLTTEQLVADTGKIDQCASCQVRQTRFILVAHSWGTYLGMLVIARHPELYHAYVGWATRPLIPYRLAFKMNTARQSATVWEIKTQSRAPKK